MLKEISKSHWDQHDFFFKTYCIRICRAEDECWWSLLQKSSGKLATHVIRRSQDDRISAKEHEASRAAFEEGVPEFNFSIDPLICARFICNRGEVRTSLIWTSWIPSQVKHFEKNLMQRAVDKKKEEEAYQMPGYAILVISVISETTTGFEKEFSKIMVV